MAKYDLNYSRRSLTLYSGSVPAFFRIMTSQFGGSGEKWYNRDRGGLRCTRITSGIPMTCQGLPGGGSTTEISFVNDGVGRREETKHHRDDLYLAKYTGRSFSYVMDFLEKPVVGKKSFGNFPLHAFTEKSGTGKSLDFNLRISG